MIWTCYSNKKNFIGKLVEMSYFKNWNKHVITSQFMWYDDDFLKIFSCKPQCMKWFIFD